MQAHWGVLGKELELVTEVLEKTGEREPGWVRFPVQDAWTQALRYSNRRRETSSRRAVAWWEV